MPEEQKKTSIGDYNKIMSDRNIFNQIVYTSLPEALRLLEERQKDKKLVAKVRKLLKRDVPEVLKKVVNMQFKFRLATCNNLFYIVYFWVNKLTFCESSLKNK